MTDGASVDGPTAAVLRIDVITLFPDWLDAAVRIGVLGRAIERGQIVVQAWNLRDYAALPHRNVDDRPFGGGPGMVLGIDPLRQALAAVANAASGGARSPVIVPSPQGETLTDQRARALAKRPALTIVCGRYEGFDQRFLDTEVDLELSLGDYVLSGGEPAALVLIDALARLVPGVLGDADSADADSFGDGLLDHPHYTRPPSHALGDVPDVLTGGDHREIARWRRRQSLERTWRLRPDLLQRATLDDEDRKLLAAIVASHSDVPH